MKGKIFTIIPLKGLKETLSNDPGQKVVYQATKSDAEDWYNSDYPSEELEKHLGMYASWGELQSLQNEFERLLFK